MHCKRTEPEYHLSPNPIITLGVLQPRHSNAHCVHRLVLSGDKGELEEDVLAGEAAVDGGVGVEAVVDGAALLLVKDNLEGLGAVLLDTETLANDLDGVDEVGEDGVVDGSEGARTGTLLLKGVAGAAGALGAGEDTARSDDQDVAVRELLLELTGETEGGAS